jgi:hypothetical protein
MPTFEELDAFLRSLPEVEVRGEAEGRPAYAVRSKVFVFWREPRKDAVDPETGARLLDVLVFRTQGLLAKDELLSDPRLPLFTTPHFDGWPGVLMCVSDLPSADRDQLEALAVHAWEAQAPRRLARSWRQRDAADDETA